MFKLCHQIIQNIKYYYFELKTEKDKINELKIVLNYLFNLDYYIINCKSFYEKNYNKQITIYIEIENINKIPNNITKLCSYNIKYLNNLPLHLKWLIYNKVNCNLPPNIIFISCNNCDIHNLPKSLIFLFTSTNIHNEIILNNNIINVKKPIYTLVNAYYHYYIFINFNLIFNYCDFDYNLFYILK